MIGDELRGFERALVLQVGSDAGGAEGVVATVGSLRPAARARRWIMR
jgi:hypothetical protein